jgi:putative spermidine/putrescine transport system substrate-binding protein
MKKIMSFLLCITVMVGAVACGQATPVATEVVPPVPTQVVPPVATDVVPIATTEPSTTGNLDFTGKTITIGLWGGAFSENVQKAYIVPFEADTGAKVIIEEYGSDVSAMVKAQVQQDTPGFDLISGVGILDQVSVMTDAGALQKFDWSKIPNADDLLDSAKYDYAMGQYMISTNFVYNTELYPNGGPDDAKKFFDVENYPGPRALINFSPTGILEEALIADGVAVEDLYPLDVDRAFKVLDRVKPSIVKWWGSGAEIFQTLTSGESAAGSFWIAHAYRAQTAGAPIVVSMKDMFLITDCWAIPTNAQNLDVVYAFLNYTINGQRAANYTRLMGYAPLVKSAYNYLTEAEQAKLASYPSNEAQGFWVDVPYWTENFEALSERYLAWIAEK